MRVYTRRGMVSLVFFLLWEKRKYKEKELLEKKDERFVEVSATYYGGAFHGKPMANGGVFDMYNPTTIATANRSIELGTTVEIKNPRNGKVLKAVVTDRMAPYLEKLDPKRIDLSLAGAQYLGFTGKGMVKVLVKFSPPNS